MNRRAVIAGTGAALAGGLARLAAACTPAAVSFTPTLFELRSYRAQPGRRDELIGMFEDVFLDAYQAGGARIVGTFRVADDADRWVWMRAFADAVARGPALRSFYGGAVWKRNADACNATIADIDEALLLREVRPGALTALCAPAAGSARPSSLVLVASHPVNRRDEESFADLHAASAQPLLEEFGAHGVAALVSDYAENLFPRQPVRAGSLFASIARFESMDAYAAFEDARRGSAAWREAERRLASRMNGAVESLRLIPCARSALR